MEATKALILCVMVVASLLASPTAARDPFVGLSIGGSWKRASSSDLECCNNCDCAAPWVRCRCDDRTRFERGCTPGCNTCRCDPADYPSCYCADDLDYCPDPCGFASSSHSTASSTSTSPVPQS